MKQRRRLSGIVGTRSTFYAMHSRCDNPNATGYPRYGGRGIKVCARWSGPDGFRNFLADMGPRPDNTTIDRIDNCRGYEPANCRWANAPTQCANRRLYKRSESGECGLGRNYARMALKGMTGRLLGFQRTERLMLEIREALEEAFGPPRNLDEAPQLSIEDAFLTHDYRRESLHFEGLDDLSESIRPSIGRPKWLQTRRERERKAA